MIVPDEAAAAAKMDIARFVAALPEKYQPIYRHPDLSRGVSRDCVDRLAQITAIYCALEKKIGRPLRVLDLGCAQGFFSLNLAALGAEVTGVDFQMANFLLCAALALENPGLKARFEMGRVEDVIANIKRGDYDLALGLSVFHHIAHLHGVGFTQQALGALAEKTLCGIYEMALATEPQQWARSQPPNPRDLLTGYAFVHDYARNATHLSDIARPLYIASNQYWLLNGEAEQFDTWKNTSHFLAGVASGGTRRYYFSADKIAKLFDLENPDWMETNRLEYEKEIAFLAHPPAGFAAPRLLAYGRTQREVWLVREKWPGVLLIDLMAERQVFDPHRVIREIVAQLAALESAGLYHDDVRVWNILIAPDGSASLIDHGAIAPEARDCLWPHDPFLAFVTFMRDVLAEDGLPPAPERPAMTNPDVLPEPYRAVVWQLFGQPRAQWRFAFLRDRLMQTQE